MKTQHSGAAIVVSSGMSSDVAAVRSLGRRGIPIVSVGFDSSEPVHHSKYTTKSKIVDNPSDNYQQFVAALLELAAREDVHTMIPLNGFGIHSLINHMSEFKKHLELPLVDPEQYEMVRDRKQLFDVASSVGLSVPSQVSIEDANNSDKPVVAKPRYTVTERDNSLQYPEVRIINKSISKSKLVEHMGHMPLIQEFVSNGSEFGYFAVFDHGEPVVKFQHKRIRSTRYSGGASVYRESTYISELEQKGEKLLRKLNWHGPAMVEFRRDPETSEFYLMEINPRFWGSLVLGIEAGVDFPYVYYQLSNNQKMGISHYNTDVKSSYLRGELQHLYSVALEDSKKHVSKPSLSSTIINQLSTVPRSQHDMFDLDDPIPFFADISHTTKRFLSLKMSGNSVLG